MLSVSVRVVMESIKVIKWFINLVKKKETPTMNILGTPVMIATIL